MEEIKFQKKSSGKIFTFFEGCESFVILKDAEGRQHHMRIDELVRDFSTVEDRNE